MKDFSKSVISSFVAVGWLLAVMAWFIIALVATHQLRQAGHSATISALVLVVLFLISFVFANHWKKILPGICVYGAIHGLIVLSSDELLAKYQASMSYRELVVFIIILLGYGAISMVLASRELSIIGKFIIAAVPIAAVAGGSNFSSPFSVMVVVGFLLLLAVTVGIRPSQIKRSSAPGADIS